jgi:hypothetical protein
LRFAEWTVLHRLEIEFLLARLGLVAFLIDTVSIRNEVGRFRFWFEGTLILYRLDRIETFDEGKGVAAISNRNVYRLEVMSAGWAREGVNRVGKGTVALVSIL